jgi:hypothetical protein
MGYYINHDSKGNLLNNKVHDLVKDGAELLKRQPETFIDNLVCVVDNGLFTAAGYAFDELEFEAFTDPNDTRMKWWLIHPMASRLSGYDQFQELKKAQ